MKDILKKIDIVEVISSYIPLKKTGNSYSANCPFHKDDTPSLFVSPSRGIFKCFGCGVGGDAIKFVSLYEGIGYLEAYEKLAIKYNLPLIKRPKEKDPEVLRALSLVNEFYQEELSKSKEALDYLASRNITSKFAKRFGLGFSPKNSSLIKTLREANLIDAYLKTNNLIKLPDGQLRDLFRNRLIIPIFDIKGNVIGFGARSIDNSEPKYLNSSESEVFQKSKQLFGLYQAIEYIKEEKTALLVEGYMDVISLHQSGFRNALAPLGTSLTSNQAKLLSSIAKKVIVMFDGDEAGKRASKSAICQLLSQGIEVLYVSLPPGEDPDSLSRKDTNLLKELLIKPKNPFEVMIEEIKNGNKNLIDEFLSLCECLKDEISAFSYISEIAKITNLPVTILANRLKKTKTPEKENHSLTYSQMAILKYFIDTGYEPNSIDLTPELVELVEKIKQGRLEEIPPEILKMKIKNIDLILESLKNNQTELSLALESAEGLESIRNLMKKTPRLRGI
ncbi:MAG: DNA primase [Aquificaceae bacterium]